ncbi:MAG: terminase small subunit [Candidatus Bathyarchaeota archaeon]|jgi:phage terminase small subunit
MANLTAKQKKFCEEYLIDLNATQAAIRAGYSKNTAEVIGHENLRKPNIDKYINECKEERSKRTEITADKVLREIALVAFQNPQLLFEGSSIKEISELDEDVARTVAEVTVRIERTEDRSANVVETVKLKQYDKLKALDMLSKHVGIYEKDNNQKKIEITPEWTVTIKK